MNESNKKKLMLTILAIGLGIIIFIGYRILYMAGISEYAKEFTAGCIGSVITIFATAALLRSQTESEVTKDQLAGMFREKLELYKSFIEFLNTVHSDGEITSDEIKEIVEWGGKLSLVCRPGVIRVLYEYAFQIVAFGSDNYDDLSDQQNATWKKWMLGHYDDMAEEFEDEVVCSTIYASQARIITMLRDDLAHKKISNFDENLDMQDMLDNLFSLHSVIEINFNSDDTYDIEKFYEQPTKKRGRKAKNL